MRERKLSNLLNYSIEEKKSCQNDTISSNPRNSAKMALEQCQNGTPNSAKMALNISERNNKEKLYNYSVGKSFPRNHQEETKSTFHPDSKKVKVSKLNTADYKLHPYSSIKHLKELYVNAPHFLKDGKDPKKFLEMMVSKAYDQVCMEKEGRIYGETKYRDGQFGIGYCQMIDKYQKNVVGKVVESFVFDEKNGLTDEVCRLRDAVWDEIQKELKIDGCGGR